MLTCIIVGMHFHPPAKALLKLLPSNATLDFRHELENGYSQFAVQVFCRPEDIQWSEEGELACIGMGHSREDIEAQEWILLGHLGENKVPEGLATSVEITRLLQEGANLVGHLAFAPEGKPLCQVEQKENVPGLDDLEETKEDPEEARGERNL